MKMMRFVITAWLALASNNASAIRSPKMTKEHQMRKAFVEEMEEATDQKRSQVSLESMLLRMAKPFTNKKYKNHFPQQERFLEDLDIELRDFALKYVGCSNIKSFSDDMAQDQDATSVLVTNRFAIFRFCPSYTCGSYGQFGCQSGYGEYMMDMTDYLQTMADYHYKKYAEYCEACAECMETDDLDDLMYDNDDLMYDNGNSTQYYDDDYQAQYSSENGYDTNYTNANYTNANYTNANYTDTNYTTANYTDDYNGNDKCQYRNVCKNYDKICQNYQNLDIAQYEDYFQCAQFEGNNNENYYLGPHCSSDGSTIEIGAYKDEYCSEYLGNNDYILQSSGIELDEGMSFYSQNKCIPCINYQQYYIPNEDDDGGGNKVYDFCTQLYEGSAKCNRYMSAVDYNTEEENSEETMVCNYIESLVEGNYDQFGNIVMQSDTFDLSKWNDINEYGRMASRVSFFQVFGLVFSFSLVMFLAVYSGYLHRKIMKRAENLYGRERHFPKRESSGVSKTRSGSGYNNPNMSSSPLGGGVMT